MTMRWRRCMADEALTALKAEIEAIHPAAAPPAMLAREECAVVAKPEWWNDEGLKVMSTRVMRLAPPDNAQAYNQMRALVLCGRSGARGRRCLARRRSSRRRPRMIGLRRCALPRQ